MSKLMKVSFKLLDLFVIFMMTFGSPMSVLADPSPTGATITTELPDYPPGEIVLMTGEGWAPLETVHITVNDTIGNTWILESDPDPVADDIGVFTYEFQLPDWFVALYTVTATGFTSGTATVTFTDLSVGTYDQCANDDGDGYDGNPGTCLWTNGNLQRNNSTYNEGDATVQRLWMNDLVPGSTHTVTFKYGTTKGGAHAYDYLTTWNWSENWITLDDLCAAPQGNNLIPGCNTALQNQFQIPNDPNVPNNIEPAGPAGRQMTIAGGTITAISVPALVSGEYQTPNWSGDSETVITVSYTVGPNDGSMCSTDNKGVTTCGVMFWFGAHVSLTAQWMDYDGRPGATGISGSPYHVSLDATDGVAVGQRDNQMQAGAVPLNGTITIVKDAIPDDSQDFNFNLTNGGTFTQDFSLDDDTDPTLPNSRSFSLPAGTYTASELFPLPVGWTFTDLVCTVSGTNGSTFVISGAQATIDLKTAFTTSDTVTCTYTDTMGLSLTATKTAIGSYNRTITWTLDKSVSPASHEGYAGDSFDSTWTVVATKLEVPGNFKVEGEITINNPNNYAVPVTVADTLSDGTVASVSCPDTSVPANGSLVCTYTASPADKSAGSNTATITSGDPNVGGTSVTQDITWSENPPDGYDSGDLTDPRFEGDPWNYAGETISDSTTKTFDETFTCPTDASLYMDGIYQYTETNTAYLDSNINLEASAVVDVTCHLGALEVSKTAFGEWDRTVTWTLDKSVVQDSYSGYPGDEFNPVWTVDLTKHDTGPMNYYISGEIKVYNPANIAQTFAVADVLDDGTPVTVTCPSNTVAAGDTVTCTYEAFPVDNSATLNTVTITFAGNTPKTATAEVKWHENLTGSDSGDLTDPRFSYDENFSSSTSVDFTETFACSTDPADYENGSYTETFTNDAYFKNDGTNLHADAQVGITCYWPQIELVKTGDDLSKIGDDVTYTINLENKTPVDWGMRDLSCTISDSKIGFSKDVTLASGASDLNTINFTIPDGASDPFVNIASASCSPLGSTFSVSDSASWSTNLFQPKVEIIKTGPDYATSGDTITFTFTINNLSSADSPNLMLDSVSDNVLGNLKADALAAGCDDLVYDGTCTFTKTYTVPDVGLQPYQQKNIVTVHYHPAEFPNDIRDNDDHTVTLVPKSQLTDTSYCPLPNDQFRLLYRLYEAPNIYLLNSSNPGQFYFNAFYYGAPGSDFTMTIEIPYPFMTQEGAGRPIQVHDGTGLTSSGCYAPTAALDNLVIETQAMEPTSSAGYQIITSEDYSALEMGQITTVTVTGTVPGTGLAYVTIHLDYSLKRTQPWKPTGTFTTNPVSGASLTDLNNADIGITIHGYEVYEFSRTAPDGTHTSTPSSYNEIKKFAGFLGFVTNTDGPMPNVQVEIYDPNNNLIVTLATDEDGYYMYPYKHKGKKSTYTVILPDNSLSEEIEVKANGFAAIDFEVP